MDSDRGDGGGSGALEKLTTKLSAFLTESRTIKCTQFLLSLTHLCHVDTQLAHHMWIEVFPKVWAILTDRQRSVS